MAFWTYQVKPSNFSFEKMLADVHEHNNEIVLQPRTGGEHCSVGDFVYLCETDEDKNAGILGAAQILALPKNIQMPEWQKKHWTGYAYDHQDLPSLRLRVLKIFARRVLRKALRQNAVLKAHPFSTGYRATMRELSAGEAKEIDRLADS